MGSFMQSFPMWGKQYLRCSGARVDYGDLGSIPGTLGKVWWRCRVCKEKCANFYNCMK